MCLQVYRSVEHSLELFREIYAKRCWWKFGRKVLPREMTFYKALIGTPHGTLETPYQNYPVSLVAPMKAIGPLQVDRNGMDIHGGAFHLCCDLPSARQVCNDSGASVIYTAIVKTSDVLAFGQFIGRSVAVREYRLGRMVQ